jgi:hypothetical protein
LLNKWCSIQLSLLFDSALISLCIIL